MKKRLFALLLAAALALTLAACGEKDIADTPLPDEPPEPVAEQPAADDEWTVLHADDVLLHTEPFTLCDHFIVSSVCSVFLTHCVSQHLCSYDRCFTVSKV